VTEEEAAPTSIPYEFRGGGFIFGVQAPKRRGGPISKKKKKNRVKSWFGRKHERELRLSQYQPEGPFPFVLVLDQLKASFNVGKLFRTANALGCRELHLVNVETFDPNPAKGTLKQTRSRSFKTFQESHDALIEEGYTLYAMDPTAELTLGLFELPEKTAFVLGHEEYGLSFKLEDFPKVKPVRILQFGRVNSMNVAVAGALASYEYVRQYHFSPIEARRSGTVVQRIPVLSGRLPIATAAPQASEDSRKKYPVRQLP
jgi:tRNA G18 (ribose-2'-O)-methylase SpoU